MGSLLVAVMIAVFLLVQWARERERETRRFQENCPHLPEQQKTIRVSDILHPGGAHLVIPGRRYLRKHCLACGWQRSLYAPTLQPYDEYLREFDQETIDREAEFQARTQAHFNEQAWKKEHENG